MAPQVRGMREGVQTLLVHTHFLLSQSFWVFSAAQTAAGVGVQFGCTNVIKRGFTAG